MKTSFWIANASTLAVCLSGVVFSAEPQFPNRPVRLIVPVVPGGGTDLVSRLVAQRLGERWGQTVVVENRAGATGLIAMELCARATPDGYTLCMLNQGQILTGERSGKLSFAPGRDFTPITLAATSELLLVVNAAVPVKSVKELVDLARAKPGALSYASGGTGSIGHLATGMFASMAGIRMTHVPYKGTAAFTADLLSGQVQVAMPVPVSVIQYANAGRIRVLAVTGSKRTPTLPDAPTFAEAGYPAYRASVWFGLFGPAKIPKALLARLHADANWAAGQPEMRERLATAGIDPAGNLSQAEFIDFVARELVIWKAAAKLADIH